MSILSTENLFSFITFSNEAVNLTCASGAFFICPYCDHGNHEQIKFYKEPYSWGKLHLMLALMNVGSNCEKHLKDNVL